MLLVVGEDLPECKQLLQTTLKKILNICIGFNGSGAYRLYQFLFAHPHIKRTETLFGVNAGNLNGSEDWIISTTKWMSENGAVCPSLGKSSPGLTFSERDISRVR